MRNNSNKAAACGIFIITMWMSRRTAGILLLLQQLVQLVESNGECMYRPQPDDALVCRSCEIGTRVLAHCGPASATQCTPCEPGTYADTCNDNFQCKPCDTQCIGEGWTIDAPCTRTRNLRCKCQDGYRYRWRNGIIYCAKAPPTTAPPATVPTTRFPTQSTRIRGTSTTTKEYKTTKTRTSTPEPAESIPPKSSIVSQPRAAPNTGANFEPSYGILFYVFHGIELSLCVIILLFLCGVLVKCRPVKKSSFFKPGVLTYPGSRLADVDEKTDFLAQELGYYRHEHAPSTLDRILQALELRRGIQVIDAGSHYRLPPPHSFTKH